ncbi:MAG: hypothetical protein NTY11_02735 [Candidatus Parcubacteria bacterium]|nr:hypothetical protein [Candidatus Parcubacteria bacterium]
MTRRRRGEDREVMRGLGLLDQFWQKLIPAIEDCGGSESDLLDVVRRIPGGTEWMAQAILERLGIYQVPGGINDLSLEQWLVNTPVALDERLPRDRDKRLMISPCRESARNPDEAVTFETPLLCEAYDGHGNPTVSRGNFLRYWRNSRGVRPATVEEVLGLLYWDPNQDLPIWRDRILIFGSRCHIGGAKDIFLQLTSVSPKGHLLSPLYGSEILYLNKLAIRVAFIREENIGEKDADEERDVGDKK